MNEWLEKNFIKLSAVTNHICSGQDVDELLQFCIDQFLQNKKVYLVPDDEKLFYFARLVKNNFHSNTSRYHNIYRKRKWEELGDIDIQDNPYEDFDELRWVYQQIENDKHHGQWYYARLFEIYISQGCSIIKTSKKTTIPLNSVSRDVNKYRRELRERRKNRNK